jgi:hypothetical protein
MVNPCLADQYLDYWQFTRITRTSLARVLPALADIPDLGGLAAGTTFTSPASARLKSEVAGIGGGIRDAETRLAELITFLAALEAKYERLFLTASAERDRLAQEANP